ncbi:MAG: sn-glycerol-3-phosphate import ATP-binding protein UgpC [Deltaproteobacteria bacterium]|nr:sn-glycerol-3-phosphate import ATP-binding protein UgpC [Deltaproteobacteria bacterium]
MEAMTMADRIGVLREGELVQIGTPAEIYSSPADVYVACRLGSPQINLLPKQFFDTTDFPNGVVTLGIRPEDVVFNDSGQIGTIIGIENLGADTVLLLKVKDHEISAYADSRQTYAYGDELKVGISPDKALLFNDEEHLIST